jgi:hypothetical protein
MPWDITIRLTSDDIRSLEELEAAISVSLPETLFYTEPSGLEKLAAARATGVTFPPSIDQHLRGRSAHRIGLIEHSDFSITFLLGEEQNPKSIAVEVRGNTKLAATVLDALASSTGWQITEDGSEPAFGTDREK